jgi:two-component system LytT family sensor kinase
MFKFDKKQLFGFYFPSIFIVTQITGILLSLVVCYILADFTWQFIHTALINSFILGATLNVNCILTQYLLKKMRIVFIVVITFSVITGVGCISLVLLFFLEPALFVYYNRGAISFLVLNYLFITALQTICTGSIIYKEMMLEKEKTISNERLLKNQVEMKLLSERINPHFLFNTLNMIITLLKEPVKAEHAILNLSDLLRDNLDNSEKEMIPIQEEVTNVRKYLEIQKLRFEDKLDFSIKCDIDFMIPPLILQPLVENCIKHNIKSVQSLSVGITIYSTASKHIITIIDSQKALDDTMLNRGHGLTITKKRVEKIGGTFLFVNGGVEISFNV